MNTAAKSILDTKPQNLLYKPLGQIGQPLHLEQLIVKPLKYKHDAATLILFYLITYINSTGPGSLLYKYSFPCRK